MRRDVQDVGIVVEHRLCAVAVVHVDVDDRDAFETAGAHRRRGDRNIVEQAEPHRSIRFGVVPRRTDERDSGLPLGNGMVRRLNSCAGGEPGNVV